MIFKRYSNTQSKANKAARARACGAQDTEVLRHPELTKMTWSAEMPAYYGTELCADKNNCSDCNCKYCYMRSDEDDYVEDDNGTEKRD